MPNIINNKAGIYYYTGWYSLLHRPDFVKTKGRISLQPSAQNHGHGGGGHGRESVLAVTVGPTDKPTPLGSQWDGREYPSSVVLHLSFYHYNIIETMNKILSEQQVVEEESSASIKSKL